MEGVLVRMGNAVILVLLNTLVESRVRKKNIFQRESKFSV